MYCLVISFDVKTCICDTCHKHLSRNEMSFQAVFNKMSLDHIPDELKDLKKLEKILISKKIIFKKIPMMQGTAIYFKQQIYALFYQGLKIQTD